VEATGQPVAEKQALHAILKPVAEPTAPPASSLAAAQRPAQAFSSSGGAEQRSSSEQNFIFPAFKVQEAERDMLKEADSRPPSGPQAGLVADAEAGRFLLMQLKGPETVAREDGKRLLHHLRRSFEREDERKASAAQRDAQWQAARFRKLLGGKV
jgi:hypothetical protein